MFNNMIGKIALAGLCAGVSLSAADDLKWHVGGALANGSGNVQTMGGVGLGLHAQGGFTYGFAEGGAAVRPFLGLTYLTGSDKQAINADGTTLVPGSKVKTNLMNLQVGADLVVPIGTSNLSTIFGFTMGKFTYKTSGAAAGEYSQLGMDAGGADGVSRTGDANGSGSWPGVKLGYRFGFEYNVNKQMAVNLMLQSWQMGRRFSEAAHARSVNPAWMEVGVKYTF